MLVDSQPKLNKSLDLRLKPKFLPRVTLDRVYGIPPAFELQPNS